MKNKLAFLVILGAIAALVAVSAPPARGADDAEPAGQTAFMEYKCNMCHSVPAAGIEAKTKSEKMRGADLGGPIDAGVEAVAAYLRKEGELNGQTHKKAVDISTEDTQTILDWLAEHARSQGCGQLHLDSGTERTDAHRFYEREGFCASSLHFRREL